MEMEQTVSKILLLQFIIIIIIIIIIFIIMCSKPRLALKRLRCVVLQERQDPSEGLTQIYYIITTDHI